MRRAFAVLATTAMAAGLVVAAAGPSQAAGETFKVVSVNTPACTSGAFALTVQRANLGSGAYTVRTVVTVAGKVYMNEDASISGNGNTSWYLFDIVSYGPVPPELKGTWPIPQNREMRIDISLEKPKGTPLYRWATVVDSCNEGHVLYNGTFAADMDRDLVPTPVDLCPTLQARRANGCPLLDRTLTLGYDKGTTRFVGWLYSRGAPKMYAGVPVTIWKARPGPDLKVRVVRTNSRGFYSSAFLKKSGTYYATTAGVLRPRVGQVLGEKSLNLKL